ncbi:MAG: hypothetical protein ACI35Y_04330 [Candidatus Limimorpha sp.]|nr:hypothetical protein [Bacteroidales bacterium]MCI7377921.1 hypothetical protein [Bacteroidales bacterium]MDD5977929.1 hypothetical protein [Bacteroidales bacterium]
MNTLAWIIVAVVLLIFVGSLFITPSEKKNSAVVVNLKIQACERLLLYLERIQYPVLLKRIFMPGMTRDELLMSLVQNVQEELEHNLAQRLYVGEDTWLMIQMAKDEALGTINAAFVDNPDSDAASIAQLLVSSHNNMIDKAVIKIKVEFNSL